MAMIDIRAKQSIGQPLFRRDSAPGNSFIRFITAHAVAGVTHGSPYEIAAAMWPSDRDVIELTRAASAPAMVGVAGWAAELAHKVVLDALQALGPVSAAAQIIRRGLVLNFDGTGQISAPGFVAGAGNAGFVAEGQPIPVRQLASTVALLNPHKLATIAVLTRELIESSNAEAAVSDVLIKSAGIALDTVFFDANPESAARPAGMKNGGTPLVPSAATDLWQAAFEDIAALINAIAPVAGNGPYLLIGSPGRVAAMQFRFNIDPPTDTVTPPTFYATTALGDDLAVIGPAALVAAASPTPDVETVTAGTLVMDTAPGPAGTMGTEKSMFQTDAMAIKVRWPLAWAMRDIRGFAWLTPNWKPG
jgi:hypothetical protein